MNYRARRNYENLERKIFPGVGEYGIPQIKPVNELPTTEFIGFNYAKTCKKPESKGIHFFLDDYQFNRIWTNIDTYVPIIGKFSCAMAPDFSTYLDFPKAIQIYNHYRKHWVAAYLQEQGVIVIPTISWSDKESYSWCFDGEPCGGIVAVSSVGCMRNKESKRLFIDGWNQMISRLHPEKVVFQGVVPEECMGNIVRIKSFSEKWKEALCDGW